MNCTISEYMFAASAALFLTLTVTGASQSLSLLTALRLRHMTTWNLLGRPDGTTNADDTSNAVVFMWFLWRRDYLSLGDTQLLVLCESFRNRTLLSILFAVVALVCLAATPSVERTLLLQCWRSA